MSYQQPRSPELRHPVPTHPAYIPEPPTTPNSPQGYQRFASSPPHGAQPPAHQQPQPFAPASYGQNPGYGAPQQSFGGQQPQHPAFSQPMGTMGQGTPSGRMGGMGTMGDVPAPDYGAWGMNDATAQFGMQLGQSAVQAGQQYVQKNFGIFVPGLPALKHHFNVSSSYVSTKLLLVLFPWKHRSWTRKLLRSDAVSGSGPGGTPSNAPTVEWVPPREDINSPDLYIPSMALVTYILLAALQSGLQERFHPEILGYSASKALAVVIADYVFVKCGCYFLNIQGTAQSFDLVSYGGYKFVGVILVVIAGLLNVGRLVYTIVFAYAFLSNAFFLLRSLRQVVLTDPNTSPSHAGTVNQAQRKRRITFLFLVAVSQVVYMGILVRV